MDAQLRFLTLVLSVSLAAVTGCDKKPDYTHRVELLSDCGMERITLVKDAFINEPSAGDTAFRFSHMVWEKNVDGGWKSYQTFRESDLMNVYPNFVYPSRLERFDAAKGVLVWSILVSGPEHKIRTAWKLEPLEVWIESMTTPGVPTPEL